jgi:hypothetical protein
MTSLPLLSVRAVVAPRLGPALGVAGSGLVFAGLLTASGAIHEASPADSGATIAATYAANADRVRSGVALALLGLAALLPFLAWLRARIRLAEGAGGWLGSTAFGGGLVAAAGIVLYLALLVAQSGETIGADPEAAGTLILLGWEFGGLLAPAFAALVGGASLATVRYRLLPRGLAWVAWLGLPLALGLALAGFLGGALVMASLLWLGAYALALAVRTA